MASGIREIRQRAVQLIEAATPDFEPAITFRAVAGNKSIEDADPKGSPAQTSRGFQIWSEPITTEGFLGGCNVDQQQRMTVLLRYYARDSKRDAWVDVKDMFAGDSARIEEALLRPPVAGNWIGTVLDDIRVSGATSLYQVPGLDHVWFGTLDYLVTYRLDGSDPAAEFVRLYATAGDLTATAGEVYWNGSTRSEIRRLESGDVYYWTGSEWSLYYAAGDVPDFASVALMEAATLAGEELGSIGGTPYQMLAGVATELGVAQPTVVASYTSIASLLASSGSAGDRAVLVESAGGTPLVWYRYIGDLSLWWPEEFIFDGLTAAEQAVWDSLVAGGSSGYTWHADGVRPTPGANGRIWWEGLYPAGASLLAIYGSKLSVDIDTIMEIPPLPLAANGVQLQGGVLWSTARNSMAMMGPLTCGPIAGTVSYSSATTVAAGATTTAAVGRTAVTSQTPGTMQHVHVSGSFSGYGPFQALEATAGGIYCRGATVANSADYNTFLLTVYSDLAQDLHGPVIDLKYTADTSASPIMRRITTSLGVR